MISEKIPTAIKTQNGLSNGPALNRNQITSTWIISFTDMIALMLTFFVLLFSMSEIDEKKWYALFGDAPPHLAPADQAAPARIKQPQLPENILPSLPKDYILGVLNEKIKSDPLLAALEIAAHPDGVVFTFPMKKFFDPAQTSLKSDAQNILFHLSPVLHQLNNPIKVTIRTPRQLQTGRESALNISLERAWAVTHHLQNTGYGGKATFMVTPAIIPPKKAQTATDRPMKNMENRLYMSSDVSGVEILILAEAL